MDFEKIRWKPEGDMKLHRGEVPFLYYPALEKTGLVRHGFSTRLGGVSQGIFSSMNLSFYQRRPGGGCEGKLSENRECSFYSSGADGLF